MSSQEDSVEAHWRFVPGERPFQSLTCLLGSERLQWDESVQNVGQVGQQRRQPAHEIVPHHQHQTVPGAVEGRNAGSELPGEARASLRCGVSQVLVEVVEDHGQPSAGALHHRTQ